MTRRCRPCPPPLGLTNTLTPAPGDRTLHPEAYLREQGERRRRRRTFERSVAPGVVAESDLALRSFGVQEIKGLDATEVFGLAAAPSGAGL